METGASARAWSQLPTLIGKWGSDVTSGFESLVPPHFCGFLPEMSAILPLDGEFSEFCSVKCVTIFCVRDALANTDTGIQPSFLWPSIGLYCMMLGKY
jgi:hypothetical protein